MSDQNAWMPLYVGDYLADTMHLTGPEHGAYLLLLMHAWRNGPLPSDERKLAAIARTDLKAWREMCETILAFFTWTDDGLVQGRLERIRSEQGAKIEQRRAAGKASAEARKAQRKSNDRSTTVEAPLPPRATEPESESEIPSSLRSDAAPAPPPPSVAGPAEPPPDARTALFREGLDRICRLTGKPPNAARPLIGRMLKAAGDDAALVSLVLAEAEVQRPADPMGWITAALRSRTGQRAPIAKPSALDGWVEMMRCDAPQGFDFDGKAEEVHQ